MSQIQAIKLPDYFYLARHSRCGFAIPDVMPWKDALSYVTDGIRFGVQFRDGRVEWLLFPVGAGVTASHYRMDEHLLPPTLRIDRDPRDIVRQIWRDNTEVLAGAVQGGTRSSAA